MSSLDFFCLHMFMKSQPTFSATLEMTYSLVIIHILI